MNQPQILNIKMVPAGFELVIYGLSKLPYENVAALILELKDQAIAQLEAQAKLPLGTPEFGEPEIVAAD